ncbi:sigma factor-like helix-turn-helix DNA-binding protein [Bacillus thuringiensis]|uniref:sigma factor-like helix-turn-helix DNA-binding protein n=1 Tax=Bacillus thuringiensis TaxID=1428 RepID=UPI002FBEBFE1
MFDWLRDYQKLEEEIAYLEYKLDKTKAELKRWISGDLQNVRLTAQSEGAKVEGRIETIEYELAYKMNEEYDLNLLINKFTGLDHQILKMKYIDGMTLEQIAFELHYSTGYIRRKHAEIRKVVKFLDGF